MDSLPFFQIISDDYDLLIDLASSELPLGQSSLSFFFSVWSEVVPKPFVLLRILCLADESACGLGNASNLLYPTLIVPESV